MQVESLPDPTGWTCWVVGSVQSAGNLLCPVYLGIVWGFGGSKANCIIQGKDKTIWKKFKKK